MGLERFLLGNKPNDQGLSFKIEWIDMQSYANECPVCMLAGGEFNLDGSTTSWKMFENKDFMDKSIFAVKQDIRLLKRYIIKLWVNHIEEVLAKHGVKDVDIDYVIPHVSSMFFYKELLREIDERNIDLLENKWFTNLTWVGNMGSASIFVALDELVRTKELQKGETILLLVPESGRFSYGTVLISVV